jgi:hypothetical protein
MTPSRVLEFRKVNRVERREPVSPFRHLMPERPLTVRQLLHRQRIILAIQTFGGRQRLPGF